MGQEIERKFLVIGDAWRTLGEGKAYRQGYIPTPDARTVRVRVAGNQGYLTLKGPALGLVRSEYEYPIPLEDANEMLETLCDPPLIEKTRYRIPIQNLVWEVDEFWGENAGLIMAEVELTDADQSIEMPDWIGQEVTGDPRYYNSQLRKNPFSRWDMKEP